MAKQSNLELVSEVRTTVTRLVKKLRKHSATGVTLSLTERSVMGLLNRSGEMLPNELATAEKITTQSMSQILNHLTELGYINRRASKEDKRKSLISLSAKGMAIVKQVGDEKDNWLYQAVMQTCTAAEIQALKKALAPLKKIVDFEDD
ncbi:MarR family winged helix-turn-helix transcriptional regulator [Parafilimonas terrae]|jgi:DNA-binding MarR family transcriptional regulator|uniref:DNA-binding transcriptional regulator, MarR family n=1 Tax=Parafilimonas terrae TaxID=1465490 RepID=A0A1I5YLV4_9BACT|nr:MarR family transcriptional regulator [Parafilimonas terrae]SFQ45264.1 DNA-binding transcriptional regulator, MarR family [Parafilimonas terrae]